MKIKHIIIVLSIITAVNLLIALMYNKNNTLGGSVTSLQTDNAKAVTTVDNGATTSLSVYLTN